jgi:hypothetical protein
MLRKEQVMDALRKATKVACEQKLRGEDAHAVEDEWYEHLTRHLNEALAGS